MSNPLLDLLNTVLPFGRKKTASGWEGFSGHCCVHNHQPRADTKKRAGLMVTADETIVYNCFNCGFKASWSKGHQLSQAMRKVLTWHGASDEDIKKVNYQLYQAQLKNEEQSEKATLDFSLKFETKTLPTDAKSFTEWGEGNKVSNSFLGVVDYVINRGEDIFNNFEYYWSPSGDNGLYSRVIIPFKYQGKIVGWTARSIKSDAKLRYYTNVQPNFLFNNDVLYNYERKYVIIVEGPFDAIAIDGVATLGEKLSKVQIEWIKRSGKEVIYLPDRDMKSSELIDIAIENEWMVSYPWMDRLGGDGLWDTNIKDAAEACKKYGRLYTLYSIIECGVDGLNIKTQYNNIKNKMRRINE